MSTIRPLSRILALCLLPLCSAMATQHEQAPPPAATKAQTTTQKKESTPAADQIRADREMAGEIMAQITDGTALWLGDGNTPFFAIFTEENMGAPKGGIILLHDAGAHPNWRGIVGPLRAQLPRYGWATLSIQLPDTSRFDSDKGIAQLQTEAYRRIQAAIDTFVGRNIQNIVIIGHGTGASLAGAFLSKRGNPKEVRGFIGISMNVSGANTRDPFKLAQALEDIRVPILDIFGNRDRPAVINSADIRVKAARRGAVKAQEDQNFNSQRISDVAESSITRKRGHIAYRQIQIAGADHYFYGLEDTLVKRVRGWLRRHAAGTKIQVKRIKKRTTRSGF